MMRKILLIIGFIVLAVGASVTFVQASAKDSYYCPMHPSYTSDKPGTCPICNMNLVKKDPGAGLSEKEQVQKHLGDICLMHNCHKGHQGRPCPMMVVVKKGEKVSCPICGTHVAGFPENSEINSLHTTIKIDAQKRQLIGVKTASVEEKALVRTIRAYGKIARDSRWVYAQVFEYERPFLYIGEKPLVGLNHKATVDLPALPGKTFSGRVRLLEREIDPVTRTTLVRIQLDDWNKVLKQDMSANVNIQIDLGSSLTVPQSAVIDTGTRQIVFIDRGEGLIEPRRVVLGERGDDDFQVISGLAAGEKVIVSGNFLIDSESRLKAVLENVGSDDDQAPVSSEGHQHGK
ncbi:MAG: efflux RND transporter periplasmic adaptor subunit [Candidatus Omnitrophica bacterium]|nr:efflux RND transporter periplasmic adaptor subunit [Candidatus Omnitrophota bacterium]